MQSNRQVLTIPFPNHAFEGRSKLLLGLANQRFLLISLIFSLTVAMQVWEYLSPPTLISHILELALYFVFMVFVAVLIGMLLEMMAKQEHLLNVLDVKHKTSMRLIAFDEWDALVGQVVELPRRMTGVDKSWLYVRSPLTGEIEEIARWERDGSGGKVGLPLATCAQCLASHIGGKFAFSACQVGVDEAGPWRYCLPVADGSKLIALLQFQTTSGRSLSDEQTLFFESIGDELSIALKVGQHRQVQREIHSAEVSVKERRKVSHFLHDNLAQNIGYLNMKLGQIQAEGGARRVEILESDLDRMVEVSNESFQTVRGTLETLALASTGRVEPLLEKVARKIGGQAQLEVSFQTSGKAGDLSEKAQQALLYAYQEVLTNIGKHAHARRVDIQLYWEMGWFMVQVADDGVGFEPQGVPAGKHFGLGIMEERINDVNGWVEITSGFQSGTTVRIGVPAGSIAAVG